MATHHHSASRHEPSAAMDDDEASARIVPLALLLEEWTSAGVITPDQARAMRAAPEVHVTTDTRALPGSRRSGPLAMEVLGYLGGVIIVTAALLIAGRHWNDLTTGWRVGVVGLTAVALLAAGTAAPGAHGGAAGRIRAVLWLGSTAALAGMVGIVAQDALGLDGTDVTVMVACAASTYAVALWTAHRSSLQQIAMMVWLALTAVTLIAELTTAPDLPGVGAWAVGLVWAWLGWRGVLSPRVLGIALGSATAVVGAMSTSGSDAGTVLTLVTVCALVAIGGARRDLVLITVGGLGAMVNLPRAVGRWFPQTLLVPYILLVVGGILVLVAVRAARRSDHPAGTRGSRR
jgi:hypothetical protein